MAVTVRLVLRKDKKDKSDLCPIAICVTYNRQRFYHSTGNKVNDNDWDAKAGIVIKTHKDAKLLNAKCHKELSTLQRHILTSEMNGHRVTGDVIRALIRGDEGKDNFISYGQTLIDEIKNPGTHRRYRVELDELREYGGSFLSFGDITPVFLSKYCKHLTSPRGDKPAKEHNTAINAFKFIRLVFNHAIKFGVTTLYPFKRKGSNEGWDYPRYEQPKKGYLTLEECDRIWAKATDMHVSEDLRLVGVFFCLECFSGLRVSDWGKFSIERIVNQDELFLRTTKTGVDIRLPLDLMPRLRRTVDYILDNDLKWTLSGEHANRMLKLIAPLAKVNKHLTTHVARHSCATHLLAIGMSREGVAEILGVSLKIVGLYAQFSPDKIRNELKRLGGAV